MFFDLIVFPFVDEKIKTSPSFNMLFDSKTHTHTTNKIHKHTNIRHNPPLPIGSRHSPVSKATAECRVRLRPYQEVSVLDVNKRGMHHAAGTTPHPGIRCYAGGITTWFMISGL